MTMAYGGRTEAATKPTRSIAPYWQHLPIFFTSDFGQFLLSVWRLNYRPRLGMTD